MLINHHPHFRNLTPSQAPPIFSASNFHLCPPPTPRSIASLREPPSTGFLYTWRLAKNASRFVVGWWQLGGRGGAKMAPSKKWESSCAVFVADSLRLIRPAAIEMGKSWWQPATIIRPSWVSELVKPWNSRNKTGFTCSNDQPVLQTKKTIPNKINKLSDGKKTLKENMRMTGALAGSSNYPPKKLGTEEAALAVPSTTQPLWGRGNGIPGVFAMWQERIHQWLNDPEKIWCSVPN